MLWSSVMWKETLWISNKVFSPTCVVVSEELESDVDCSMLEVVVEVISWVVIGSGHLLDPEIVNLSDTNSLYSEYTEHSWVFLGFLFFGLYVQATHSLFFLQNSAHASQSFIFLLSLIVLKMKV